MDFCFILFASLHSSLITLECSILFMYITGLLMYLQVKYSKKELTVKRDALCVWLAENRVPYTIKDDLSIEV